MSGNSIFRQYAILILEENTNSLRSEREHGISQNDSATFAANNQSEPADETVSDSTKSPLPSYYYLMMLLLELFYSASSLKKLETTAKSPSINPINPFKKGQFYPTSKIIRYFSTPAFRKPKFYRPEIRDTHFANIQLKRAQLEEKYIDAKNRLDFNKRRNNLAGDRLKREQQEVALFLEKLRKARSLERKYVQQNSEPNEMESDEIYDTTDSEIQMDLSNPANDETDNEETNSEGLKEVKEAFDLKQVEEKSKEVDQWISASPTAMKKRIRFKSDRMGKVVRTLVKYEEELKKVNNETQYTSSDSPKNSMASPPRPYRHVYKRNKGSFRVFVPRRSVRRGAKALFPLRAIPYRDRSVHEMSFVCGQRGAAVLCEVSM